MSQTPHVEYAVEQDEDGVWCAHAELHPGAVPTGWETTPDPPSPICARPSSGSSRSSGHPDFRRDHSDTSPVARAVTEEGRGRSEPAPPSCVVGQATPSARACSATARATAGATRESKALGMT